MWFTILVMVQSNIVKGFNAVFVHKDLKNFIVLLKISLILLRIMYKCLNLYINSENISDRYYVALYKKMLEPDLKYTAKQAMFLNLLFKSLKKDVVERRVKVSKT